MIKNSLKNKFIVILLLVFSFIGILSINISVDAGVKNTIDPDGGGSER